jgi:hypothetical protein
MRNASFQGTDRLNSKLTGLAVSSGGGHWIELLRLRPGLEGHLMHYVTVNQTYERDVFPATFNTVSNATRWNPIGVLTLTM